MKFYKSRNVKSPNRGTSKSAGIDFFIPEQDDFYIKETKSGELIKINKSIILKPGQSVLIPSGIHTNIPDGYALVAFNKSGIAAKKNIVLGACLIDEDYEGEIHFDLKNIGNVTQEIESGDKITQLVCLPINYVELEEVNSKEECFGSTMSERGEGGFGSTGTK